MTKRHYIAVAQVLASELASADGLGVRPRSAVERVILALADLYAAENARFDRAVFLAACGVEVSA